MIAIAIFILSTITIMVMPIIIPFLLLSFQVINGIASRDVMANLKVTVGGTNIFFPDLIYAASFALVFTVILGLLFGSRSRKLSPLVKLMITFILLYIIFFIGKLIGGYLDGVPLDSLVRSFSSDTQCIYFFIPVFFIKDERALKQLLYFAIILSLLYPLAQPFLYGSEDQLTLQKGQGGTLRLGFGNANLILMLGVLAIFVWEKKIWLSAVPLAGIAMLAQRSAFISITACILIISIMKNRSIKFISLAGMIGVLLVLVLIIIQTASSTPVASKAYERLNQTFEKTGTTMARARVIPLAISEVGKRPALGFSYSEIKQLKDVETSDVYAFNMLHPHNFFLSSLLRTGLIGTLLLSTLIILSVLLALKLRKIPTKKEHGIYLLATTVFFIVYSLMNTSYSSAGYIFWILAGISSWYLNEGFTIKNQEGSQ